MVPSSHADCAPWAFGTSPSHRPHLGRTALPNGRQNASVFAQGCADLSFGSANRPPKFARYLGWTSPSIRSDLVFGTHRWDNRIFIPLIRQEYCRRQAEGLPRLPISGPRERERGGRSAQHDPPRDLAEVIAKLALEKGIPAGKQRSWKTVAKTMAKFAHLELIPAHQLVDGRSIAYHPGRITPLVEQVALRVIETDFATREFESVSGTEVRVNQSLSGINELRS